jgi:hypothetical protein
VVDMKDGLLPDPAERETAILAAVTSTFNDATAKSRRNRHGVDQFGGALRPQPQQGGPASGTLDALYRKRLDAFTPNHRQHCRNTHTVIPIPAPVSMALQGNHGVR